MWLRGLRGRSAPRVGAGRSPGSQGWGSQGGHSQPRARNRCVCAYVHTHTHTHSSHSASSHPQMQQRRQPQVSLRGLGGSGTPRIPENPDTRPQVAAEWLKKELRWEGERPPACPLAQCGENSPHAIRVREIGNTPGKGLGGHLQVGKPRGRRG